ncbi:hypothetical protein [Methylobacter sp. sgz302048]|uniref:hypothetical protein n=1 Tax=Methylobacter sp. sgz302048 TaxID=3455945 RepID=UPI003F9F4C83
MAISQFWKDREYYTLLEISFIACGYEPQNENLANEHAPASVVNFFRTVRDDLINNGEITQGVRVKRITYPKEDAIKIIDYYGPTGFPNFLKESTEQLPLTDNERDKLLKQIGLLALVLAEKSSRYKRGEKPNANQIATDVQSIIDATELPGKKGTGSSELRDSISQGLKLLRDD